LLRFHSRPARPPRPDCQPGPTTAGIDVSYHQDAIDWPRVARAGIRFAFIRVADGATIRDVKFATNWAESRRAGLVRGAYLFFRPDQSVDAQSDIMLAALRADRGDLPPVIDVEVDGGLAPPIVAARARAWVDRVRAAIGVEPIVYTNGDLWKAGGAAALAAQPLWIAHYTQGCPTLPAAWTRWRFWQHTDHGAVPGITGDVDLDVFSGALGDLQAAR
jgi:lysozyme